MKKCSYCGRENSDEAVHCRECGTEFVVPSVEAEPAQPRDGTWLEWLAYVLRLTGTILLLGFLYLLSLGPVGHFFGTVTTTSSPPATFGTNGQATVVTSVRTVRYPGWVRVVYYPAFVMMSGSVGNSLYGRYLMWWDKLPGGKS